MVGGRKPARGLGARLRQAAAAVGCDLAACVAVGFPSSTMRPGLRSYRLNPPGGKRRVHLRVESDGSSLLLLDANDTLRLNPAATLVADLALRGFRRSQIAAARARRFGRSPAAHDAAEEIEQLIARLRRGEEVCLGCTLAEAGRAEPFSSSPSAPLKADLALTYRCNNACGHCYNPPQRTDMGSLDVRQWTAVLRRLRTIGVPHVVFTGGEPTLCDELPPLVRRAGRLGLVTGLNSNGRRLGQTDLAKRLARAGLDHVQITLESPRAETHNRMTGADSFAETVRGVGRCLDAGLHTITNTTLTRRNLDEAEELVDFLHGLGLRTFAANGMICAGAGRRHPDTIAEAELGPALVRLRDRAEERDMRFLWYTPTAYCRLSPLELELGPRRCNAAEYSICIEPNGQVLPCQSYYTPAGNILRDPWAEIWNSPLFRSFRERIADPAGCGLPRRCWECPERAICGGGCRLMEESACRGPCGRPEYQEAGHDGPTASLEGLGASPQTLPFISE